MTLKNLSIYCQNCPTPRLTALQTPKLFTAYRILALSTSEYVTVTCSLIVAKSRKMATMNQLRIPMRPTHRPRF